MCPICDGAGVPLGQLGKMWFRCRQCGMVFSADPVSWLSEDEEVEHGS